MHHLKQRTSCRMCREGKHKPSVHKKGRGSQKPGMNVENPESVGIAQRHKRHGKKERHSKKALSGLKEFVNEEEKEERHKRHKRTGAMPYRHQRGGKLKLNPPSKGHKPKGAHGKAAVHALGRTKTTGNFKKIEAAKGKGAAINAYQNALKAHKAGKMRKHRMSEVEKLRHAGKEGSGKRAAAFRKLLAKRHK